MEKFPISFWEYMSIENFSVAYVDDWADCGMTIGMSPGFQLIPEHISKVRQILDAAAKRGIKVMIQPARPDLSNTTQFEKNIREHIQNVVKYFGDHEAVFGVFLSDEPKKGAERLYKLMRTWREEVPHWQPFINLLPWHFTLQELVGFPTWAEYLDDYCQKANPPFISFDCYYQMNPGRMGEEIYFTNLKEYSSASIRNKIPFWVTLMCCPHFEYRYPTEDELRWQMNTALAWGARGIMWFHFSQRGAGGSFQNYRYAPINEFGERTQTYISLSNVNRHLLAGEGIVLNKLQFKQAYCMEMNYAWGGFPVLDPGWRVQAVNSDCPMIISEFKHPDGSDYIALTNMSRTQNAHPTFAVAGKNPDLLVVGSGGTEVSVQHGGAGIGVRSKGKDFIAVHQYFAPGQMYLFRVVDAKS